MLAWLLLVLVLEPLIDCAFAALGFKASGYVGIAELGSLDDFPRTFVPHLECLVDLTVDCDGALGDFRHFCIPGWFSGVLRLRLP